MPAAAFGCLLGACNVVFIAIGLQWRDPSLPAQYVIELGMLPGILTGALVGGLARATAACSVWARRTLLATPSLAVVVWLAHAFELEPHVVVASIPTLVAVMVLERHTRVVEPLPAAVVARS